MTPRYDVLLTHGAEQDLEAIHRYIAEHRSSISADDLLDAILERVASLERFPSRGAVPPELERLGMTDFRQMLCGPYRLVYQIIGDQVFILVVADGRRDMEALLRDRLLRP